GTTQKFPLPGLQGVKKAPPPLCPPSSELKFPPFPIYFGPILEAHLFGASSHKKKKHQSTRAVRQDRPTRKNAPAPWLRFLLLLNSFGFPSLAGFPDQPDFVVGQYTLARRFLLRRLDIDHWRAMTLRELFG